MTWYKQSGGPKIDEFHGENRFLSNFHPSTVGFEGKEYPSVEAAYQAAKTLDTDVREQIRLAPTPGKAKRLGRKLDIRDNWDDIKIGVMENLVRQKFSNNPELREMLLNTADKELIEGNHWGDIFWGVSKGIGKNNLGIILMKVRDELRQ